MLNLHGLIRIGDPVSDDGDAGGEMMQDGQRKLEERGAFYVFILRHVSRGVPNQIA